MYEWLPWIGHYLDEVPKTEADRIKWLASKATIPVSPEMRKSLEKWYGSERASKVKHAEAFEVCEYGAQPTDNDVKKLFPMLGK